MLKVYKKPIIILLSILLLALSMWYFGHRQLGGFDMSALVDTGWRMANGQIPYFDFPLTTPVAFYIGADWAIQLFGARWSSFVLIAIIFTIASFVAQYYLLNRIIPWSPALAISLVSQLLCSVVTSYWWYNAITMNAACLFLSAAYVFVNKPNERSSAISLWASLTLLGLMKPNIAGGLAVLVYISLFIFTPSRKKLFLVGFSAIVSFLLLLLLLRISPLDVFTSYITIGKGRAAPTIKWFFNDKPYEHWVVLPLILLSLLPTIEKIIHFQVIQQSTNLLANFAVTIASFINGGLSLLTNSDTNLTVGIPFFLLGSAVFFFLVEKESPPPVQNNLWFRVISAYLVLAMLIGNTIIQANYHAKNEMPNIFAFWYILAMLLGILAIFILIAGINPGNISFVSQNWQYTSTINTILLVAGGLALFAGGMRWRVSYIGIDRFFSFSSLTKVEGISFFENFYISPDAKTTISEIQQVLVETYGDKERWSNSSVFFGPRIEFAYAVFGIDSPRGLPIWWHPNNSYPADHQQYYVQSFLDHDFDTLIFVTKPEEMNPDFTYIPPKIVLDLQSYYERRDYSNIVVYQKK